LRSTLDRRLFNRRNFGGVGPHQHEIFDPLPGTPTKISASLPPSSWQHSLKAVAICSLTASVGGVDSFDPKTDVSDQSVDFCDRDDSPPTMFRSSFVPITVLESIRWTRLTVTGDLSPL